MHFLHTSTFRSKSYVSKILGYLAFLDQKEEWRVDIKSLCLLIISISTNRWNDFWVHRLLRCKRFMLQLLLRSNKRIRHTVSKPGACHILPQSANPQPKRMWNVLPVFLQVPKYLSDAIQQHVHKSTGIIWYFCFDANAAVWTLNAKAAAFDSFSVTFSLSCTFSSLARIHLDLPPVTGHKHYCNNIL